MPRCMVTFTVVQIEATQWVDFLPFHSAKHTHIYTYIMYVIYVYISYIDTPIHHIWMSVQYGLSAGGLKYK